MKGLKVLKYELEFDGDRMCPITLDRAIGLGVERWAIRIGDEQALCKVADEDGLYHFYHEVLPSSRDDNYYAEFRWASDKAALKFWHDNRSKILATSREKQEHYWRTHPPKPLKL